MASYSVRESFFRPTEHSRQASALPADLYNDLQLLLKGQTGTCAFVPLRALQYQAVVERDEVIFVDSQGGYAHQDGVGGRLIRVAPNFTVGVRILDRRAGPRCPAARALGPGLPPGAWGLLISNEFQPFESSALGAGRRLRRRPAIGWGGHGGRNGD
jgi:hypothetical protein